ncbi:MAG TPA: 4'-phosphopantetheinyl transferase superfamily protein [Pyrinomonadaceae bacterium]|jgi:4'-phosphopantetheinyl transferase|nr:4'-phosphopantetheinyl transferase superfamily protein [Pyrinomonadaceae bacterium]
MLRAKAFNNGSVAVKPSRFPGLALDVSEVHLWQASLEGRPADIFESFLSADELARANRFHFAEDRTHFVVARGLLRNLLAAYLGIDCAALRFSYGVKGKPFVVLEGQTQINFNLSHSHGRAAFAFTRGRELGVDLEYVKPDFDAESIATRFFSRSEVLALRTVPAEVRNQAFFNCWTRKEAYIKARGEGLSMPLDEFDVSLRPGEPAALLNNYREEREVKRWSMKKIPTPADFVGALVVEGHDWQLKSFSLEKPQAAQVSANVAALERPQQRSLSLG